MRILAATNNKGKLEEIRRILEPLGISIVCPDDLGLDIQVDETGTTFAENAYLKAKAFYEQSGLPSLADDSGLCIDAMGGRPGVHSARYLGKTAIYKQRFMAILEELKNVPPPRRTARFVCAICCVIDEETILRCEGICEGMIGQRPAGMGGFGYDPLFYVGENSFAQLTQDEKDAISHRGKALRAFAALLEQAI